MPGVVSKENSSFNIAGTVYEKNPLWLGVDMLDLSISDFWLVRFGIRSNSYIVYFTVYTLHAYPP